jgi:hypothetical protein
MTRTEAATSTARSQKWHRRVPRRPYPQEQQPTPRPTAISAPDYSALVSSNVEQLDDDSFFGFYATHKTPEIQRWLLRHPRFHLHFTPTSGSWPNMVERWFAELTTKKIKRGAHTSVEALEADIRDWIEHWNDDPRPYVWVKTADQILDAWPDIANESPPRQHPKARPLGEYRYLWRLSSSGH